MIRQICAVLICATSTSSARAQNDTSYHYISDLGRETTADSANLTVKMVKASNGWSGKTYYKNGVLRSEGMYLQDDLKTPVGVFKNYDNKGEATYISEWANPTVETRTWYYKDGKKKATITYRAGNSEKQVGWDEQGKEIKGYVVEKEARFKGGAEGWRKYLEKHLNANVAADAGAPEGLYTVKVQFIVDKEGNVSNVKAATIPEKCKPCAKEAVNVIAAGPAWEPAIQNDRPVIYQAIQFITFQVVDDGKKKKKG